MKNKLKQKNIPDGWTALRLGDIGYAKIGLTYSPSDVVRDKGILVFRSSNIKGDKINYSDQVRVNKKIPNDLKVKEGDILICARNGSRRLIGKNVYISKQDEGNTFGAFMSVFRTKNSKFIYHLFQSYLFRREIEKDIGPTINQVTTGNLLRFKFTLPPLPEQKRIVAVLETWDEYLEKLKRKIEIKKNIKKGLMQQLLTGKKRLKGFKGKWQTVKLGDIGKIVSGGTPDTNNINYWNGNILWVTPTEITKLSSKFLYNTERRISLEGLNNSSATLIPKMSLILCSRATIGECAINKFDVTTNQGFKNIVPSNIDINFLYYFILTKKKYLKKISSGSTFLEFSKRDLEKMPITIPMQKKEQTAIANILTKADEEIEALEKKKKIIEEQKKYLLNNLITGKLRTPENLKRLNKNSPSTALL